jgi:hypothetical protein
MGTVHRKPEKSPARDRAGVKTTVRGGLTAEEYRWKLIREWGED